MKRTTHLLATAVSAFAGGYLAGLLFAPQSGRKARQAIASQARAQTDRLEAQLHALEEQLIAVEQQLEESGYAFSERVRGAAQRTLDHYLPTFDEAADEWKLRRGEVTRDLRRMPRS